MIFGSGIAGVRHLETRDTLVDPSVTLVDLSVTLVDPSDSLVGPSDTLVDPSAQHKSAQHVSEQNVSARHAKVQHASVQHSSAQHASDQHAICQHGITQHASNQHDSAQLVQLVHCMLVNLPPVRPCGIVGNWFLPEEYDNWTIYQLQNIKAGLWAGVGELVRLRKRSCWNAETG